MIKISGGEFRSRNIKTPDTLLVPTKSMVREAVASMTLAKASGARCLDLFAGSGAVGIELLSRGAAFSVFAEKSPDCAKTILKNIKTLQIADRSSVFQGDALEYLRQATIPFDIVFIDPPYKETGLYVDATNLLIERNLLAPGAVIVYEYEGDCPVHDERLRFAKEHRYGKTKLIKAELQ